ncbi:MAG: hypothetical protein WKG00_21245 [Polyangiaceae bacterium]
MSGGAKAGMYGCGGCGCLLMLLAVLTVVGVAADLVNNSEEGTAIVGAIALGGTGFVGLIIAVIVYFTSRK